MYLYLADIEYLTKYICETHFGSPLQYIVYSQILPFIIFTIFQFRYPILHPKELYNFCPILPISFDMFLYDFLYVMNVFLTFVFNL